MSVLGDPKRQRPFILASASPRRASLLREYNYEFDIVVAPLEEPERLADANTPAELAEAQHDALLVGLDAIEDAAEHDPQNEKPEHREQNAAAAAETARNEPLHTVLALA